MEIGTKVSHLTVIEFSHSDNGRFFKCICDCGKECVRSASKLNEAIRNNKCIACGCLVGKDGKFHISNSIEYACYKQMIARCYNPKNKSYKNYGGRGIKVCERWLEPDPMGFYNYIEDMGQRPGENHSTERIDVDGDYTPSNCTWATRSQQTFNRRVLSINTSGLTGVSFKASDSRWLATIAVECKKTYLGYFDNLFDAVCARKSAECIAYPYIFGECQQDFNLDDIAKFNSKRIFSKEDEQFIISNYKIRDADFGISGLAMQLGVNRKTVRKWINENLK